MKIFMAGYYAGRDGIEDTQSIHLRISQMDRRYPHILESYHYIKDKPMIAQKIREHKNKIFLDSGAFSMHTKNVQVDLTSYAKFIRDNSDIIHTAANLDAIKPRHEQLSYDRLKQLEGLGVKPMPVHHVRDRGYWLQKYLDEGYDYIALGGMVGENKKILKRWLDHVWRKYLLKPDGTPKVRVHAFGLTDSRFMFRYQWASCDSTAWIMTSRNGGIFLDLPSGGLIKDCKIEFSSRSSKRFDVKSSHFNVLTPLNKKAVLARLEQLEGERIKYPEEAELQKLVNYKMGFNSEAFSESYGWRDIANIFYFGRLMNRFKPRNESNLRTMHTPHVDGFDGISTKGETQSRN